MHLYLGALDELSVARMLGLHQAGKVLQTQVVAHHAHGVEVLLYIGPLQRLGKSLRPALGLAVRDAGSGKDAEQVVRFMPLMLSSRLGTSGRAGSGERQVTPMALSLPARR